MLWLKVVLKAWSSHKNVVERRAPSLAAAFLSGDTVIDLCLVKGRGSEHSRKSSSDLYILWLIKTARNRCSKACVSQRVTHEGCLLLTTRKH